MKENIKRLFKTAVQFFLNPRLLLCFGIGWMITNGWSYVLFGLGTWLRKEWMVAVSGAYLAFLWLPFTPEKFITITIAITLLRWLFPQDKKTLGILKQTYASLKRTLLGKKQERKHKNNTSAYSVDEGSDMP